MGRTALKTDGSICATKPYDDAQRGHRTAAFGQHDGPGPARNAAPIRQRVTQVLVQRDQPATAFLCGMVAQLNSVAECASRTENHVPRQVGDLTRPKASFGRK